MVAKPRLESGSSNISLRMRHRTKALEADNEQLTDSTPLGSGEGKTTEPATDHPQAAPVKMRFSVHREPYSTYRFLLIPLKCASLINLSPGQRGRTGARRMR